MAVGHGVARKAMIACGIPVAERVFRTVDPEPEIYGEGGGGGAPVAAGTILYTVEGRARSLLTAERVSPQSHPAHVRDRDRDASLRRHIPTGSKTRITDAQDDAGPARLERYAVRRGGHNHRNDLGSAVPHQGQPSWPRAA